MMNFKDKKAQTAIELAIFGAILIFVMGATIRSVVGRAQQQQAMFRATRMALTLSHSTTETKRVAGRNMGTVLVVEDRLTSASSKYGAIDRMPFMTQGSGIHSVNLFMPIDYGDDDDLPVFDVFVNGQHFVFRVGVFKYVYLANSCDGAMVCHADCKGDCAVGSPQVYRGASIPAGPDYWEDNCLTGTRTIIQPFSCADPDGLAPWACPDPSCIDCTDITMETYTTTVTVVSIIGCARLYLVVNNHPLIPQWCDDITDMCPANNLSANDRFRLDRWTDLNPDGLDGKQVIGAPPLTWEIPPATGGVTVPVGQRPGFAWQWFLIAPVDKSWRDTSYDYSEGSLSMAPLVTRTLTSVTVNLGEGIVLPGGEAKAENISLDVDYDLKLESIMPNVPDGVQPNVVISNGIIARLGMMDSQEGDIDFSYNESDKSLGIETYGFDKDVNVYTYVRSAGAGGGTYLQIDEGHLFSGKQYIRTASKKDQVDLIERVFRLSNDTGEFCGTVVGGGPPGEANGAPNPIEACGWVEGECFTSANINKTCFDVPNKLFFIRSRIEDRRGRKWVTDQSTDPYVNFVIN